MDFDPTIYNRDRKRFPVITEWRTDKFVDIEMIVDPHITHQPYGFTAHSIIINHPKDELFPHP
jgi:hypothetical protein